MPVWTAHAESLSAGHDTKIVVAQDAHRMTYAEVLQSWQSDAAFCAWFNDVLADAPCAAFKWETPPLTPATIERPFECVLLDSPGLDIAPDATDFAEHFHRPATSGVVEVPNLGGDAILVIPTPIAVPAAYAHIGTFVRQAPEQQRLALWQAVGAAMARRLDQPRPVWLSTAGGGVAWLHVRLDDRPKYYGYTPYRQAP